MSRIRTGRPNGRPPSPLQGKETITTNITFPVDVVEKIDRLRTGAESRKDVIVRVIRQEKEG